MTDFKKFLMRQLGLLAWFLSLPISLPYLGNFIKEKGKTDTFSRLFSNMQKQHPTNHCLQETNTHWVTTRPNVLLSYLTQSEYCMNLEEKSTNCLQLTQQFDRWNQALEHCFH